MSTSYRKRAIGAAQKHTGQTFCSHTYRSVRFAPLSKVIQVVSLLPLRSLRVHIRKKEQSGADQKALQYECEYYDL